jgi:hypothetical protein
MAMWGRSSAHFALCEHFQVHINNNIDSLDLKGEALASMT